jgi:TolA-binding protein
MYQQQGGLIPGRGAHSGPPHHQSSGSGDSTNNLFAAGEKGVWAYVQTLEDKVKQLSEKVQAMESREKSQEDKINQLSDELFSLRNQLNAQNRLPHPSAPGHS